jgi:hypothetical protein
VKERPGHVEERHGARGQVDDVMEAGQGSMTCSTAGARLVQQKVQRNILQHYISLYLFIYILSG